MQIHLEYIRRFTVTCLSLCRYDEIAHDMEILMKIIFIGTSSCNIVIMFSFLIYVLLSTIF